jgi:hypothetical protein
MSEIKEYLESIQVDTIANTLKRIELDDIKSTPIHNAIKGSAEDAFRKVWNTVMTRMVKEENINQNYSDATPQQIYVSFYDKVKSELGITLIANNKLTKLNHDPNWAHLAKQRKSNYGWNLSATADTIDPQVMVPMEVEEVFEFFRQLFEEVDTQKQTVLIGVVEYSFDCFYKSRDCDGLPTIYYYGTAVNDVLHIYPIFLWGSYVHEGLTHEFRVPMYVLSDSYKQQYPTDITTNTTRMFDALAEELNNVGFFNIDASPTKRLLSYDNTFHETYPFFSVYDNDEYYGTKWILPSLQDF